MPPPIRLKVIASIRNCSLMSPGCAPTAMRMPISRVRSVTLTSMMFMMPMPPTTSEMPAMEPSSRVMILEMEFTVSAISFWLKILKSLSRSVVRRWRWRSRLVICCWAISIRSALTIWTLMRAQIFVAGEALHGGGVGNDDAVVLVLAAHARALAFEQADDDERDVAHPHGLADGIERAKKFIRGFRADDGHLRRAADFAVGEHRAGGQFPIADFQVVRRFAGDGGGPVAPVGDGLGGGGLFGADGHHVRDFAADGVGVGEGQGAGAAEAGVHAAGFAAAGKHGEQVLAEGGNLAGDARLRAVAHGHHRHDGGDADDDAQRGEHGAHFVAAQRAQGNQRGLQGAGRKVRR
jgi:hypothetical protein